MVEYCDKCGTTLEADEERHRTITIETPSRDQVVRTGRLCSVCVVEFDDWLAEKALFEEESATSQ